jgi:hypothetical protein
MRNTISRSQRERITGNGNNAWEIEGWRQKNLPFYYSDLDITIAGNGEFTK